MNSSLIVVIGNLNNDSIVSLLKTAIILRLKKKNCYNNLDNLLAQNLLVDR